MSAEITPRKDRVATEEAEDAAEEARKEILAAARELLATTLRIR